jgi:hypothetical protein
MPDTVRGDSEGYLRLTLLRWNEPLPTDRKTEVGLPSVIKLKNESIGHIERSGQGDQWNTIGVRWRIMFDHWPVLLS